MSCHVDIHCILMRAYVFFIIHLMHLLGSRHHLPPVVNTPDVVIANSEPVPVVLAAGSDRFAERFQGGRECPCT